ncbi:uncharacterized protein Dvar_26830 [Desulfosarcina variabilis str. Montpellier]
MTGHPDFFLGESGNALKASTLQSNSPKFFYLKVYSSPFRVASSTTLLLFDRRPLAICHTGLSEG